MSQYQKPQVLFLSKDYVQRKMLKSLPGVPGAILKDETDLPGVPGATGEDEDMNSDDYYKKGFMEGYDKGLSDKNIDKKKKSSNKKSDEDEEEDDKECNMSSVSKVYKLACNSLKKMFSGNSIVSMYSPLYSEVNGVSIITVEGEIDKRISNDEKANGKVDVDDIVKAIKVASNADTNTCILNFNTPGGSSIGVAECGECIKNLCETKATFAFCDKLLASAGYWLASCTNGIYVTPTSEIGGIGVIVKMMDMSENMEMQGIKCKFYTGGELKAMGHLEKPINETEDAFIQNEVNEQTTKFKNLVNSNRGNIDEQYLQGQLFNGENAVKINIADDLVSGLDQLIETLQD